MTSLPAVASVCQTLKSNYRKAFWVGKKLPMDFPGSQKERCLLEKGSAAEFGKGADKPEK